MKFNKTEVELCGKSRNWKKCTNAQLREHQENIENMFDEFKPVVDELEELQDEIAEHKADLQDTIDTILTIQSKADVTDKDMDKVLDLIKNKKTLRADIRRLSKEVKRIDAEHKEETKKLNYSIPENMAKLVSYMVEIEPEEYLKEADIFDEEIARNLGTCRLMVLGGASSKEVEKFIKSQIKAKTKETSFQ